MTDEEAFWNSEKAHIAVSLKHCTTILNCGYFTLPLSFSASKGKRNRQQWRNGGVPSAQASQALFVPQSVWHLLSCLWPNVPQIKSWPVKEGKSTAPRVELSNSQRVSSTSVHVTVLVPAWLWANAHIFQLVLKMGKWREVTQSVQSSVCLDCLLWAPTLLFNFPRTKQGVIALHWAQRFFFFFFF